LRRRKYIKPLTKPKNVEIVGRQLKDYLRISRKYKSTTKSTTEIKSKELALVIASS